MSIESVAVPAPRAPEGTLASGPGPAPAPAGLPALGDQAATAQVPEATDQFGRDTFLQLLVAQLRYQDPLNPTEGAEFIAQTAQFTSVESLEELTSTAAQSLGLQQRLGAASLVGREVSYLGPDATPLTGTVVAAVLSGDEPVLRVSVPGGQPRDVPLTAVTELQAAG